MLAWVDVSGPGWGLPRLGPNRRPTRPVGIERNLFFDLSPPTPGRCPTGEALAPCLYRSTFLFHHAAGDAYKAEKDRSSLKPRQANTDLSKI